MCGGGGGEGGGVMVYNYEFCCLMDLKPAYYVAAIFTELQYLRSCIFYYHSYFGLDGSSVC